MYIQLQKQATCNLDLLNNNQQVFNIIYKFFNYFMVGKNYILFLNCIAGIRRLYREPSQEEIDYYKPQGN